MGPVTGSKTGTVTARIIRVVGCGVRCVRCVRCVRRVRRVRRVLGTELNSNLLDPRARVFLSAAPRFES